jgi:outer membrane protein OmpA-like peptidoglycan-associated protein
MIRNLSAIVAIMFAVTGCGESMRNASLGAPGAAPPAPARQWMAFFDTNSSTLSAQASNTVNAAAAVAKSIPGSKVTVIGYTDSEGTDAANQALSVRRANSVRDALIGDGTPPQSINVTGVGEGDQLVPTPANTRFPSNRRVRIIVQ